MAVDPQDIGSSAERSHHNDPGSYRLCIWIHFASWTCKFIIAVTRHIDESKPMYVQL
jgi:hypothetical protein